MNRRYFVHLTIGVLLAAPVLAHHGWSSFDQDKPLYLSGTLTQVRWQNPHAEAMLRVDATKLPDGFAARTVAGATAVGRRRRHPEEGAGPCECRRHMGSRIRAAVAHAAVGLVATAEGRRSNRSDRLWLGRRKQARCCASNTCSSTVRRTPSGRRR